MGDCGQFIWDRAQIRIENDYFRSKFEPDLIKFRGRSGIGVISDNDPQPLLIGSHLGSLAIVTVACITNLTDLTEQADDRRNPFPESTSGAINPTELVATLICQTDSFEDGIRQAQQQIKGSCSMLLRTREGVYAARDRWGRRPLIVGKKADGFAVASESGAFPNLGFEIHQEIGPGEVVFMAPDGIEQRRPPREAMQVCNFLNFSTSRSTLDLAGRRAITALEGVEEPGTEVMQAYATAGTTRHQAMVENIRRRLHLTTLKYQTMDDLMKAIGLPKERPCTHGWDGNSYF
jgi:glutamine phosphoribosylpyrophosphate amidotransferase